MRRADLHAHFERLYANYNQRALIQPDPLQVVYRYERAADREVAGLLAAALAYGRVAQILRNLDQVLEPMGDSPGAFIRNASRKELGACYGAFRHRWTSADELIQLLANVRGVLDRHGSIEACFLNFHRPETGNTLTGLAGLVRELGGPSSLLSDPTKPSACKRLHLYLRWMAREDDVDPGCWGSVDPAHLIVPLDTHMHRVARSLRFTRRKQANLAAALDMTRVFQRMNPHDPLRYDFVLTRFGIRADMDMTELLRECGG